ncbi:hypothetical protein CFC21_064429 [Triticum aestivum]|uniref:Uncharacterized protein n=1 Tax=Triticum aestivum TaxID=4565 RepID=A0A9R1KK80_WHEAT|nr:hypothetical protein CFC21_064429 [Triticum aestivum]
MHRRPPSFPTDCLLCHRPTFSPGCNIFPTDVAHLKRMSTAPPLPDSVASRGHRPRLPRRRASPPMTSMPISPTGAAPTNLLSLFPWPVHACGARFATRHIRSIVGGDCSSMVVVRKPSFAWARRICARAALGEEPPCSAATWFTPLLSTAGRGARGGDATGSAMEVLEVARSNRRPKCFVVETTDGTIAVASAFRGHLEGITSSCQKR